MGRRLLIIQPSYYRSKTDRTVFKVRRRQVVPLALPYLAALTPAHWEIKLIDEQLESIDFDYPADLVAITTWTLNSYRAYDIADEFRRRRVPVVLGGPHAFFHAEEAGTHCDAVGVGEAESIWVRMPMPLSKSSIASWVINMSQRRMAQARPVNNNFDGF